MNTADSCEAGCVEYMYVILAILKHQQQYNDIITISYEAYKKVQGRLDLFSTQQEGTKMGGGATNPNLERSSV